MKKWFKKTVAVVLMAAFVLCMYCPAYANDMANTTMDFEELAIEYDNDGNLKSELFKLDSIYYYRIFEDGKVTAMSLHEDGTGDIAMNDYTNSDSVDYGKFSLNNNARVLTKYNSDTIMDEFNNVLTLAEVCYTILKRKEHSSM